MTANIESPEDAEDTRLLAQWRVDRSGVRLASNLPRPIADWKQRSAQREKTCIRDQLAKACGFGTYLVKHWMTDPTNPAGKDFVTVCELCYTHELPGYFLSGTVLEEWYEQDWRGMKGRPPTPILLFERALMVKARLEEEREADLYRAPIINRATDLSKLPAAVSKHIAPDTE